MFSCLLAATKIVKTQRGGSNNKITIMQAQKNKPLLLVNTLVPDNSPLNSVLQLFYALPALRSLVSSAPAELPIVPLIQVLSPPAISRLALFRRCRRGTSVQCQRNLCGT